MADEAKAKAEKLAAAKKRVRSPVPMLGNTTDETSRLSSSRKQKQRRRVLPRLKRSPRQIVNLRTKKSKSSKKTLQLQTCPNHHNHRRMTSHNQIPTHLLLIPLHHVREHRHCLYNLSCGLSRSNPAGLCRQAQTETVHQRYIASR